MWWIREQINRFRAKRIAKKLTPLQKEILFFIGSGDDGKRTEQEIYEHFGVTLDKKELLNNDK